LYSSYSSTLHCLFFIPSTEFFCVSVYVRNIV
jgi:hypothetical protein